MKVQYDEHEVSSKIAAALMEASAEHKTEKKVPVYVLVGATSSTGDAVGPLVGWFLKRKGFTGNFVGEMGAPVHATNIKEKVNEAWMIAMKNDKFPYIVGVDAAIGTVGCISVDDEPLRPGAGMDKNLPTVGQVSIMCGTATSGLGIWYADLNISLTMAERVADAIVEFDAKWRE